MAHDVFISYSKANKSVADAVCAQLEQAKIRCWIGPRDVLAGQEYGRAIIEGINGCRVMVVVFSSASDKSRHVSGEVERAFNKGVAILPFRIEDHTPSGSMELFLSGQHWLDAFTPPLEQRLIELVETTSRLLSGLAPGFSNIPTLTPTPAGLERIPQMVRSLPWPARMILAWRCAARLPVVLLTNWLDGNYMYPTLEFLRDFLPEMKANIQTLKRGDEVLAFYGVALKKLNEGLELATRTSARQRTHSVVLACLATYISLVECATSPNCPAESVVLKMHKVYAILNPENSIATREIREEVEWLVELSSQQKWDDLTVTSEEVFARPFWHHGEPACVNSSLENNRSLWSLITDLWT